MSWLTPRERAAAVLYNVIVVAYFLKTGYCVTTRCLSFQGVDMRHPDFYSKMESD